MNLNFLCCIGAEQKHDQSGLLKMNQVYFYRAYADETMSEILEDNFFNHSESHLKENDIILAYSPNEQNLPKTCWLRIVIPQSGLVKTEKVDDSEIIETLRADLGDLGDQVAEIEAKIPGSASVINQLATQNDITNKITNCITEIPQDIKLELNNGTLILKSGSKFWRPNGAGVFDAITMNVDAVLTQTWNSANQVMLFYVPAIGTLNVRAAADCSSGATDSISGRFHFWYDTTNNLIRMVEADGTFRSATVAFPIAVITMVGDNTEKVTSIDRVFNGFGYIGSTVFTLPGVKYLIPNGRNADGSLKNTEHTKTSVGIITNINASMQKVLMLRDNGSLFDGRIWFDSKTKPNFLENYNNYWYNPDTNKVYYYRNSSTQYYINCVLVGRFITDSSAKIDTLNTKCTFQSVDYNDTGFIAHQAMPSDKYIDLTLGVSGTAYTAPADGYIKITKNATTAGQYIDIYTTDMGIGTTVTATGAQALRCFCPVAKGDRVTVNYTAAGTTGTFRFVFANGAK